jgi:anti-anti-sigma regulatory factor
MATHAEYLRIDRQNITLALQQAREKLAGADGELALDFSSVGRIDAAALNALRELAGTAEAKALKILLRGVDGYVYKALKLVGLTTRFDFEV